MWQRSLARVSSQLCAISTRTQSETNKKDSFASKPGGRVETLENPRLGYKFVFVSLLSVPDIVLLFVMGSNNRLGEKIVINSLVGQFAQTVTVSIIQFWAKLCEPPSDSVGVSADNLERLRPDYSPINISRNDGFMGYSCLLSTLQSK